MKARPLVAMENALFSDPSLDWDRHCGMIAAAGFDGVYAVPYPLSDDDIPRLRQLGDAPSRHGITLAAVYANLDLAHAPDTTEGRRLASLIERVGGAPRIELSVKRSDPRFLISPESIDDRILSRLEPLLAMAESRGIDIALYPHSFYPLETPAHAARLVSRCGNPRLRYVFASSHVYAVSEPASVIDQLAASAGEIASFNICGCRRTGNLPSKCTHFPPDEGDLEMAGLFAALNAAGYTGEIIVQGHGWSGDLPKMLKRSFAAISAHLESAPENDRPGKAG